jgi:hypothetical protein
MARKRRRLERERPARIGAEEAIGFFALTR